MKNLSHIFLLVSLISCSKPEGFTIAVNNIGALRQIMHQGQFQARVSLDTLTKKGMYGLGAMSELSGKVLVLDGKTYASFVQNEELIIGEAEDLKATLFVYSSVDSWDTTKVSGTSDLDGLLLEKSSLVGLSEPFPFQLIGSPQLDYHVINFDPLNGDFSRHKEGAFKGTISGEQLAVFGFYSTKAKGIYTHHDSNLHLHFITADKTIMGHVDLLNMEDGSYKLLTPKK